MKKLLILTALLIGCNTLQAQDWKDALSKAATSAADKATGGKLTQMAITGQWEYSGPGVKFESDDTLSELGGSALSSSVEKNSTRFTDWRESNPEPVISRSIRTVLSKRC